MAKIIKVLCCWIFIINTGYSQLVTPVTWNSSVTKVGDNDFILISEAIIAKGWYLYSQNNPEDLPVSTIFYYKPNDGYELIENTLEDNVVVKKDPFLEVELKVLKNKAIFKQRIKTKNTNLSKITAEIEYMACDSERCLPPNFEVLEFNLKKATKALTKEDVLVANDKKSTNEIFFIAFLSGFLALLTPCVFPMIPMTVSFFIKQKKTKGISKAILYGVFIICIYVGLGIIITSVFGASALNALATNVWFNVFFFLLLILFALSFLGAFELVLPSSWINTVDEKADKGGVFGIFFMALALALVSFSCTGPIVGTLLVEAASKGGATPIIGMFGFSLAIALPFTLFAIFPSWLKALPKSGGWLNTTKVVLGFLELALAFKFLSNADLVLQLHLLERELFIAIWIAVFSCLTLYLLKKLKLKYDDDTSTISVPRLSIGMVSLAFTLYLLPGLWGAPLNLISAFTPPQNYSESPYGIGGQKEVFSKTATTNFPKGASLIKPYNILAFKDYQQGLSYAKQVNKPVLLDFTGWACVNCRKMEQNIWAKEPVLSVLKDQVVVISLYVDDKRPLAKDEIVNSKISPDKKLKYIGQKWSEFQTLTFKTNTQPFYVLLNHKEKVLNTPMSYTSSIKEYASWLNTGINNFFTP